MRAKRIASRRPTRIVTRPRLRSLGIAAVRATNGIADVIITSPALTARERRAARDPLAFQSVVGGKAAALVTTAELRATLARPSAATERRGPCEASRRFSVR